MAYRITLIPGDGVGPEITEATRRVLEATGVAFQWDITYVGITAQEKYGTLLPEAEPSGSQGPSNYPGRFRIQECECRPA